MAAFASSWRIRVTLPHHRAGVAPKIIWRGSKSRDANAAIKYHELKRRNKGNYRQVAVCAQRASLAKAWK